MFKYPLFDAEVSEHQEHRMEIHGDLYWDDDPIDGACGATWDLRENEAQKDGVFRSFRSARLSVTAGRLNSSRCAVARSQKASWVEWFKVWWCQCRVAPVGRQSPNAQ